MISAAYKIFFFSFSLVLCLYYIILITAEGNTINSGRVLLRLRVLTYIIISAARIFEQKVAKYLKNKWSTLKNFWNVKRTTVKNEDIKNLKTMAKPAETWVEKQDVELRPRKR